MFVFVINLVWNEIKKFAASIIPVLKGIFRINCIVRTRVILAQWISPGSEILILPMLSYPGCQERAVRWLYWNSRTLSSSDVNV